MKPTPKIISKSKYPSNPIHTTSEVSTIHNVRLDREFCVLSNRSVEDPSLSWAAKGLLWYILSRPQNWRINTYQLSQIYEGEKKGGGVDAIRSMIQELKDHGYVVYTKTKNEKGQWEHRYDVYPMKIEDFQKMFPQPVKPVMESKNPDRDQPDMVNPGVLTRTVLPNTEMFKDNVSAHARVFKESPTVDKSTLPTKKTLSFSTKKDKTLSAPERYRLTEQQTEDFNVWKAKGVNCDDGTLCAWIKKYSPQRISEVYQYAKQKNPTNLAGYMQKLLMTDSQVDNINTVKNTNFAKKFKEYNNWTSLKILKKYVAFPLNGTDVEIPLNLQPNDFARILTEKHETFTGH